MFYMQNDKMADWETYQNPENTATKLMSATVFHLL